MSVASKIYDLWRNLGVVEQRFDKPVLQVVIDGNGDPAFVTAAMLGGGSVVQAEQTALLTGIEANTNGLLKNDMEVPFIWFGVKLGFTDTSVVPVDVLAADIIVSYVILNTTTGIGAAYTKRWRGWIDVIVPSPLTDYLVPQGGMPLTFAQLQSLMGEVQANPTQYTLLDRVKALLTGIVLAAGENHFGEVGGKATVINAELTRPANVLAYPANTVVSNSITTTTPLLVQNIFRVAGGSGYITGLKISTNKKSIVPRFRVHLFTVNTATLAADGVLYKKLYADKEKYIGYIELDPMTTAADATNSDMSEALIGNLNTLCVAATGSRDLYLVLETLDAFTPANGQKIHATVFMDNN